MTETGYKRIYGRDLKVGDLLKSWVPGRYERVERMDDYRTQVLNGQEFQLASAYCTNGYNITIFLDLDEIRIAGSES